jgi:uncharacterized spore protein YtfJ
MELKDLFDKMTTHLSVTRSFGVAYEKDGALIIPVALVAGGGGGGGTDDPTSAAPPRSVDDDDDVSLRDSRPRPLGGSGGGFGGVVMPVGVYVVKDDRVRWVPAVNVTLIALSAIGLFRAIVRSSSKHYGRRH